jgi:hypothetical protein
MIKLFINKKNKLKIIVVKTKIIYKNKKLLTKLLNLKNKPKNIIYRINMMNHSMPLFNNSILKLDIIILFTIYNRFFIIISINLIIKFSLKHFYNNKIITKIFILIFFNYKFCFNNF